VTPHIHTREDEYSIAIGFRSGDREAVQIISPAGFENFFRDLADLVDAGPPAVQDIATLASNYGLQFGDPPWLPDLIKRITSRHRLASRHSPKAELDPDDLTPSARS
jgi:hypothetical protein